jgi:catechol 2,3-dioxygenase-like lactoylglutathione lyase family enzyme
MRLLDGIHHVAFLTSDMDRLISFYERIFEARVTLDLEEEGLQRRQRGGLPRAAPSARRRRSRRRHSDRHGIAAYGQLHRP